MSANKPQLEPVPEIFRVQGPFGTVELHVSLIQELKQIAELNGKSLREVTREAVNQYLDRES